MQWAATSCCPPARRPTCTRATLNIRSCGPALPRTDIGICIYTQGVMDRNTYQRLRILNNGWPGELVVQYKRACDAGAEFSGRTKSQPQELS
jgi:hypothetical protein